MTLLVGLVLLAVGAGLLLGGAELFADNALLAGRRLGVSALMVGLLLAGAEPEELVTTVVAAARDAPGIAIGDALGANATLLTLVLGAAALVRPVPLRGPVVGYAVAALAASSAAALAVVATVEVGHLLGVLLMLLFSAAVAVL